MNVLPNVNSDLVYQSGEEVNNYTNKTDAFSELCQLKRIIYMNEEKVRYLSRQNMELSRQKRRLASLICNFIRQELNIKRSNGSFVDNYRNIFTNRQSFNLHHYGSSIARSKSVPASCWILNRKDESDKESLKNQSNSTRFNSNHNDYRISTSTNPLQPIYDSSSANYDKVKQIRINENQEIQRLKTENKHLKNIINLKTNGLIELSKYFTCHRAKPNNETLITEQTPKRIERSVYRSANKQTRHTACEYSNIFYEIKSRRQKYEQLKLSKQQVDEKLSAATYDVNKYKTAFLQCREELQVIKRQMYLHVASAKRKDINDQEKRINHLIQENQSLQNWKNSQIERIFELEKELNRQKTLSNNFLSSTNQKDSSTDCTDSYPRSLTDSIKLKKSQLFKLPPIYPMNSAIKNTDTLRYSNSLRSKDTPLQCSQV
ncbi:hypothetical protein GJ496_004316 [Pomphorhynchus laevis]|nr:hypothetical protein GJ496_004316 [Pomphorhynchus laevis]